MSNTKKNVFNINKDKDINKDINKDKEEIILKNYILSAQITDLKEEISQLKTKIKNYNLIINKFDDKLDKIIELINIKN